MERPRLTFLFHRYVNNSCTEQEEREFLSAVAESENDQQLKQLMDQLWNSLSENETQGITTEKLFTSVVAGKRTAPSLRSTFASWRKIAAVFTLGILGAGAFYIAQSKQDDEAVANIADESASAHQFIKLPDGSTVILNGKSTLRYPPGFQGQRIREVFLAGEGYFDIKHDPDKPFVVRTGKLSTTVLGTAFNVKAFPDDNAITVTVTRGKVKVSDDKKVLGIITHDQQITFDKESTIAAQQKVNSQQTIAWAEKDMFFDDITMAEAVGRLEERFRVKIRFDNENIGLCRFTATFVRGEDLDQILAIICEFNNATFDYDASGAIAIRGAGCHNRQTP